MLVQGSHSIAMFAAHTLRESNSHVLLYPVRIIRAYNIDDLFHTGRIDPPGMVKIVYIVCTFMHNDTGSISYTHSPVSWSLLVLVPSAVKI